MSKSITHLFLFTLLLCTLPLQAQAKWYKVEVVIFANDSPGGLNAEFWDNAVAPAPLTGAVEMRSPAEGGRAPFTLLDASRLRLGGAVSRLRSSGDTRPLLHFGWYQPGLDRESAVAVHVHDNMGEIPINLPLTNVAGYQLPVWQSEAEYGRMPTIEGTIKVVLSRYLHVQADLLYTHAITREVPLAPAEPQPESGMQAAPAQTMQQTVTYRFKLKESRRMRSRELHYLDHPMFGMLVQIIPLGD